jgi:hypothetical protein
MPADYYQDADQDAGVDAGQQLGDQSPDENEQPEGETALLPKSLLGGGDCQPGEKISLEVVHVYEDEVEVRPVKGDEEKESALGTADDQLAAMGEPDGDEG